MKCSDLTFIYRSIEFEIYHTQFLSILFQIFFVKISHFL